MIWGNKESEDYIQDGTGVPLHTQQRRQEVRTRNRILIATGLALLIGGTAVYFSKGESLDAKAAYAPNMDPAPRSGASNDPAYKGN